VFAGFPITANLAILSAAVGGVWLVWVRKSGRIGNLLDREHNSTQSWRDRLIASIAVINSRPGTEGPFDPQHIGQLRLSLYRADDQANNIQAIPLKALRSDAAPSADGIVVDAGPNHLQTVFQFCPVPLEPGERYAFRVTNETPRVILAFSLNTKANLRTSIDYVGEIHGEDRHRINYFQVAGYVCSLASC